MKDPIKLPSESGEPIRYERFKAVQSTPNPLKPHPSPERIPNDEIYPIKEDGK